MTIRTLDWSKVMTWTPDMIMAYHAEQQTLLMAKMAASLDLIERVAVRYRDAEAEQRETAELALRLVTEKDTVLLAFNGHSYVPLSQLRQRLLSHGIRAWGDELQKAVPLTDYLVLAPAGRGWQVWRAEDYANRKEATA